MVSAPSTMTPGKASTVTVQLTAAGDQTLFGVRVSLQVPQGWTAVPRTDTFGVVGPGDAPTATFTVTPPA